jgi:hypothetical protein
MVHVSRGSVIGAIAFTHPLNATLGAQPLGLPAQPIVGEHWDRPGRSPMMAPPGPLTQAHNVRPNL